VEKRRFEAWDAKFSTRRMEVKGWDATKNAGRAGLSATTVNVRICGVPTETNARRLCCSTKSDFYHWPCN